MLIARSPHLMVQMLRKISCFRTDFRSTNLSRAVIAADAAANAVTDDKTIWPEVIPNGTGSAPETDVWSVAPQSSRHLRQTTTNKQIRASTTAKQIAAKPHDSDASASHKLAPPAQSHLQNPTPNIFPENVASCKTSSEKAPTGRPYKAPATAMTI